MYAVDSRMKSKGILSNFSVLKVVLGVDNSPIHNYYKPCDFIVKICSDAVLKSIRSGGNSVRFRCNRHYCVKTCVFQSECPQIL